VAVEQTVLVYGLVDQLVLNLSDHCQNLIYEKVEQALCIDWSNNLPTAKNFYHCTQRLDKLASRILTVVKLQ